MTPEFATSLEGHIKILNSQIVALVAILPHEQQDRWVENHKAYCSQQGIDDITGIPLKKVNA